MCSEALSVPTSGCSCCRPLSGGPSFRNERQQRFAEPADPCRRSAVWSVQNLNRLTVSESTEMSIDHLMTDLESREDADPIPVIEACLH